MNAWIEERCETLRLALRVKEFPAESDLYRLADWLGANVILRHAPVRVPKCVHRSDGVRVVTLPEHLLGRPMDLALAHELGHVLLSAGMGALLRQSSEERRIQRLADTWTAQDEARARYFVAAWYLPSRLVQQHRGDPWHLAEISNTRPELVEYRIRTLGRAAIEIQRPPAWSAARSLHVVTHRGQVPMVYVTHHDDREPLYSFPATQATVQATALQLTADLVALTVSEFERKHTMFATLPAEPMTPDLALLRAWAT